MSGLAATVGLSIVYTLGNVMPWRDVALFCLSVPLLTMVAVCFVSENCYKSKAVQFINQMYKFLGSRNTALASVQKS